MTTIRDRRGWLARLRGLLSRGPATTEEQMVQLKAELDELLERDVQQRFRYLEGAEISDAGKAALGRGVSPAVREHVARLIGGSDG